MWPLGAAALEERVRVAAATEIVSKRFTNRAHGSCFMTSYIIDSMSTFHEVRTVPPSA
jgi:hypothetical protein